MYPPQEVPADTDKMLITGNLLMAHGHISPECCYPLALARQDNDPLKSHLTAERVRKITLLCFTLSFTVL
jgi:hypothetical protein